MLSKNEHSRLRETLHSAVANSCRGPLAPYLDDIVQEALLRILKKLSENRHALEGNDPLSASYLWKVAHSCLVDEIRKRERRPEDAVGDVTKTGHLGSPAPGPDRHLDSKALRMELEDCLSELAENRRRAVVLHLIGHSIPETAEILGWEEKRTDNFTYRGRMDLRRCLERKGLTP